MANALPHYAWSINFKNVWIWLWWLFFFNRRLYIYIYIVFYEHLPLAFCSCAMPNWTTTCNFINHSAVIQHRHWWNRPACYFEHHIEITCSEWVLLKSILVWICSLASCEWCHFLNLKSAAAWTFSKSSLEILFSELSSRENGDQCGLVYL